MLSVKSYLRISLCFFALLLLTNHESKAQFLKDAIIKTRPLQLVGLLSPSVNLEKRFYGNWSYEIGLLYRYKTNNRSIDASFNDSDHFASFTPSRGIEFQTELRCYTGKRISRRSEPLGLYFGAKLFYNWINIKDVSVRIFSQQDGPFGFSIGTVSEEQRDIDQKYVSWAGIVGWHHPFNEMFSVDVQFGLSTIVNGKTIATIVDDSSISNGEVFETDLRYGDNTRLYGQVTVGYHFQKHVADNLEFHLLNHK